MAQLGQINDSLAELIAIAKTPSQTWAYEQFDIARDALRRGLREEAFEAVQRAIDGFGTHTGYRIDHRFHFLVGTIRMPSFKTVSDGLTDLGLAEASFLTAARYAEPDAPDEAGRSMLAAGWAAYASGHLQRARDHTARSRQLSPTLGEAHFQMAKILMDAADSVSAEVALERAVEIDRNYMIRAAADGSFTRDEAALLAMLEGVRTRAARKAQDAVNTANRAVAAAEAIGRPPGVHVLWTGESEDALSISHEPAEFPHPLFNQSRGEVRAARAALASGAYFDLLNAIEHSQASTRLLAQELITYLSLVEYNVRYLNHRIAAGRIGLVSLWRWGSTSFALYLSEVLILSLLFGRNDDVAGGAFSLTLVVSLTALLWVASVRLQVLRAARTLLMAFERDLKALQQRRDA